MSQKSSSGAARSRVHLRLRPVGGGRAGSRYGLSVFPFASIPRRPPRALAWVMKIATFNINNVNRRLANLKLHWLKSSKPDVVCLQELKCADADFPAAAIKAAGYATVRRGQKTWNGVAILVSRRGRCKPALRCRAILGDKQARYIEAAVEEILVGCPDLLNGNL